MAIDRQHHPHQRHLAHDRVRQHTAPHVNERIDQLTAVSIESTLRGGPEAVQQRIAELDQEWDIDRALMVNFAVAGGTTFALGLSRFDKSARNKGFLVFFGAQLGFLLLHGLAGWCPPASLFRRLGFRTQREIDAERIALLASSTSQAG